MADGDIDNVIVQPTVVPVDATASSSGGSSGSGTGDTSSNGGNANGTNPETDLNIRLAQIQAMGGSVQEINEAMTAAGIQPKEKAPESDLSLPEQVVQQTTPISVAAAADGIITGDELRIEYTKQQAADAAELVQYKGSGMPADMLMASSAVERDLAMMVNPTVEGDRYNITSPIGVQNTLAEVGEAPPAAAQPDNSLAALVAATGIKKVLSNMVDPGWDSIGNYAPASTEVAVSNSPDQPSFT